jgi:hypothetical protein
MGLLRVNDPGALYGPIVNFFLNTTSRPLALGLVVVLLLSLLRYLQQPTISALGALALVLRRLHDRLADHRPARRRGARRRTRPRLGMDAGGRTTRIRIHSHSRRDHPAVTMGRPPFQRGFVNPPRSARC